MKLSKHNISVLYQRLLKFRNTTLNPIKKFYYLLNPILNTPCAKINFMKNIYFKVIQNLIMLKSYQISQYDSPNQTSNKYNNTQITLNIHSQHDFPYEKSYN